MVERERTLPQNEPGGPWYQFWAATDVPYQYDDYGGVSQGAAVHNLWGPTGLGMEFDSQGYSRTFTWDPQGSCLGTAGLAGDGFTEDANGNEIPIDGVT